MIVSNLLSPNISPCGFFRVRKAVGKNHQNISTAELKWAGLVSSKIKHAQDIKVKTNRSIFPVAARSKIAGIMPCADELPHARRAQQKEEERDELVRKRLFAEELVDPSSRPPAGRSRSGKFHTRALPGPSNPTGLRTSPCPTRPPKRPPIRRNSVARSRKSLPRHSGSDC